MSDEPSTPPNVPARKIFVQATSGERFEADVPLNTLINKLAADFFEDRHWPRGREQRAVVELVDPTNPDGTKRLNGDMNIGDSGVRDGDTLRVFPESIAGAVDAHVRLNHLIDDHNNLKALCARNSRITFKPNRSHAPDQYEITFSQVSFIELPPGSHEPRRGDGHRVEIILGADYPRQAPFVRWLTPIFHPNIQQPDGGVCLGVLRERYLPGMGLARLVNMLAEMVQWRNYDASNGLNRTACDWATDMRHWDQIKSIGGYPFQGPLDQLMQAIDRAAHPAITFRPIR